MSATTAAATAERVTAERVTIEQDLRFAELIARSWLEPELAERYSRDPRGVIADFGIELPAGAPIPSLPAVAEMKLVIEDLDSAARAKGCTASMSWAPAER